MQEILGKGANWWCRFRGRAVRAPKLDDARKYAGYEAWEVFATPEEKSGDKDEADKKDKLDARLDNIFPCAALVAVTVNDRLVAWRNISYPTGASCTSPHRPRVHWFCLTRLGSCGECV